MPRFIDLSNNNEYANLARVKEAGYAGVFHKASEGVNFTDGLFAKRRAEAAKVGLRFGAYHFARPHSLALDPFNQADNFCEVVGKIGRTDLRPVLDYEVLHPGGHDVAWIRAFNQRVKAKLGVLPVFYSYTSRIHQLDLAAPVGAALWLADYNGRYEAAAPLPWKKVHAHQYTDHGIVRGVDGPCDVSFAPQIRPLLAHPWTGLL